MAALVIPKAYSDGLVFTEADLDAIKDGVEALFNTDKLGDVNFQANILDESHLSASLVDDATLYFDGADKIAVPLYNASPLRGVPYAKLAIGALSSNGSDPGLGGISTAASPAYTAGLQCYLEPFTPSALESAVTVDPGTDIISGLRSGYVATGRPVQFFASVFPGGIAADTLYYMIYASDTTCKIASSYANAVAGTAINLTTAGTSVVLSYLGHAVDHSTSSINEPLKITLTTKGGPVLVGIQPNNPSVISSISLLTTSVYSTGLAVGWNILVDGVLERPESFGYDELDNVPGSGVRAISGASASPFSFLRAVTGLAAGTHTFELVCSLVSDRPSSPIGHLNTYSWPALKLWAVEI